jgi:hypothetical protein
MQMSPLPILYLLVDVIVKGETLTASPSLYYMLPAKLFDADCSVKILFWDRFHYRSHGHCFYWMTFLYHPSHPYSICAF